MGAIDFILAAVIILGAIQGFLRGFIHQLTSIVGLVVGFFIARALYLIVAGHIAIYVPDASMNVLQTVAFIGIWILVPMGFAVIGSILTRAVEWLALGPINRILGLLLGGLKWVLILGLLINVMDMIDYNDRFLDTTKKEQSKLYYPIKKIVGGYLPFADKPSGVNYIYI